ncbi:suppressor of tumorigenicity 14 -like protein [Brachionus plicatilis]|uniref:Suppressor of tumorigenicity 14-like protein n=1 Tax=Brachionus plicatilis TaxID=10195 RepID=A0A3M7QP13_BRAPC|nr:suppressor of tumorigenicity 14 -like protein [Brachionus plicatilis]
MTVSCQVNHNIFASIKTSFNKQSFDVIFNSSKLGISNSPGSKVVNGKPASISSYPFMVSIGYLADNFYYHVCGGSIVNDRKIITAKHCVQSLTTYYDAPTFYNLNGYVLVAISGISNLEALSTIPGLESSNINMVKKIYYQKDDISILELFLPMVFTSEVNRVFVPGANDKNKIFGRNVTTLGWGATEAVKVSPILMSANLTVLNGQTNERECQGFQDDNYCVIDFSSANTNVCYGDSGGPLLYLDNNKWFIYGVASFVFANSNGDCLNKKPKISFFLTCEKLNLTKLQKI